MACTYNVNGDSLSLEKLVRAYYESKAPLTRSSIYSSVQDSAVKTILDQVKRKDEILALNNTPLTTFISQENKSLMNRLGIKDATRLAPEYDKVNRVLKFVKDKLVESGQTLESLSDKSLDELKIDFSEVVEYEKEIETTIEAEDKTNKLIRGLKYALEIAVLDGKDLERAKNILIKTVDEALTEGLIVETDRQKLFDKLLTITSSILDTIYNQGRPIVDLVLESSEAQGGMFNITGHIDIITISEEGVPHIYSIRSSKRDFEHWDGGKKLQSDYQLAFQRALVAQHLNTSSSTMTIIPIKTGELVDGKLNPEYFSKGDNQNRTGDPKSGLGYGTGWMFNVAKEIIPDVLKLPDDTYRADKVYEDLSLLLPGYKIKTSNAKYDRDKLIAAVKRNSYFNAEFSEEFEKDSTFDDENFEVTSGGRIKIKKYSELSEQRKTELAEKAVDKYLQFINNKSTRNVTKLKNAIVNAVNEGDATKLDLGDVEQTLQARKVLASYLNNNYRVIDNVQELDELGIILLQDKATGNIVPISISSWNTLTKYNSKYDYLDTEYFKIFAVLNNFYDDLGLRIRKVQNIVVYDLEGKTGRAKSLDGQFEKFLVLASQKNYPLKLNKNHMPEISDVTEYEIQTLFRTYNQPDKQKLIGIFEEVNGEIWNCNLDVLKKLERKFVKEFPYLAKKTFDSAMDFENPRDYLYALIKTLILTRHGIVPVGDITGLRDFALKYQDWFHVLKAFYSEDLAEYTKSEEKILGIIGGLKTITPDRVASKDLFTINNILSSSINLLGHEIAERISEVRGVTKEYYRKINYTEFEQSIIGNYRKHFENLWLHENGEISNKWRTKNPYALDKDNALTLKPEESEYLKNILFHIQRQLMGIPINISNKIDVSSIESIKKTAPKELAEKIISRIESGEYFRMPLIRSQLISRNKKVLSFNGKEIKQAAKNVLAETRDFIDGRELDPEDAAKVDELSSGYFEMYEIYGKQSAPFIAQAVDRDKPIYYEIDLDTIASKVIQEKVRKKYADQVLPVINSYVWWMKVSGAKQNKDISKAIEYVKERLEVALYDLPIVNKEFDDVVTAASVVKQITTAGMLAFRPALLVKELSIGLFKGISLAATQYFGKDQFEYKDYFRALKALLTVDKQFSSDFNLIEAINIHYRFANLDMNTYSKKLQTNRRGIFMGISKYMYSMNTIPDYYNRLSLFLAKMMHDGSYEAHSINENGLLIYDPAKDKRFEYYFKERSKYKNPKGSKYLYSPSKSDKKYNDQRNLYVLIQEEINESRRLVGMSEFTEEDKIDQAYSEKERSSYKSYTDSVYGYYDKEHSPSWHYTWFGILYLQFMQFWPGKMSMWFGAPVDESNKLVGQHRQKTRIDANGKKVLLWRKPIFNDETGDIIDFDEVEENTGDPALEWTGLPHEGIVYSMAKTVQDTWKGLFEGKSLSEIKEAIDAKDEQRLRRVMYGLADGVLMYLIFNLFKLLLDGAFGDNPEGLTAEAKRFSDNVNRKIINESMLWDNTFGALRSEPAFWSYSTKVLGDVKDVIDGDKTIQKFLTNFKATELFIDAQSL